MLTTKPNYRKDDLYYASSFNGIPLFEQHAPYVCSYLESINQVIMDAVDDYPRTFAVRVDLRMNANSDSPRTVINRFFNSLRSILAAADAKRKRQGMRVYPHGMRYLWCREQFSSEYPHYHVLILFNADAYRCLGDFKKESGNMVSRIRQAWASALGIDVCAAKKLVHIPDNAQYRLNVKDEFFDDELDGLLMRAFYLAKANTKITGSRRHNFGHSRR